LLSNGELSRTAQEGIVYTLHSTKDGGRPKPDESPGLRGSEMRERYVKAQKTREKDALKAWWAKEKEPITLIGHEKMAHGEFFRAVAKLFEHRE
jgi:hypothetical protein